MIFERDTLSNVICNIRTPIGINEDIGTAIFVSKEDVVYILTAAHVAKNINSQSYAILSDLRGNSLRIGLDTLTGGMAFENHPIADLAKVKVNITQFNFNYLQGKCFPYNQIDISDNPISRDNELTTIGFPLGLGVDGEKFSPLSYRTFSAASVITLPRFDNGIHCDFIILELPSVGGYSGGPTFDLGYIKNDYMSMGKGKTILHGIVHGTISDNTGGKLAAITPCKYLRDWI